jgi:hypothetical protein
LPVDSLPPDAVFVPLQPPVAVHDVAFVGLHVSVEAVLYATGFGEAVKVTVGGGVGTPIFTVADAGTAEPYVFEQVRVYILELGGLVKLPVDCVPDKVFVPVQALLAVHDVALSELHVSVEAVLLGIEVGEALNVTRGNTPTSTLDGAETPPAPLQVTLKVVAEVRLPVD